MEIFKLSQKFVFECYKLTKTFPPDEKFAMTSQIRRAALSVHLNIAEGCSRKSGKERKRFYEVSRGSLIEIDAALDIASVLNYYTRENILELGDYMVQCFKILSTLIHRND